MVKLDENPTAGRLSSFQHYGWAIVGMATALQLSTNFISQAFSILIVVLQEDYGWSLAAIGFAYVLRSLVSAVLAPVVGWIGDRYGTRRSLLLAGGLYVTGLLLLSTLDSLWP